MPAKYLPLNSALYTYLIKQRSSAVDPILEALRKETEKLGEVSRMQISREQGSLFTLLVAAIGAKQAIEIGTFTGYSSLCIARGLPKSGKLTCCDISREWTALGQKYWKKAGVQSRIQLHLGPAPHYLKSLTLKPTFDFAFIDADKPGYNAYFELLLPRMRKNALMIFDNMLWGGRLIRQPLRHPDGRALHALNRKLANDSRVESVLLPLADGLMICRKK